MFHHEPAVLDELEPGDEDAAEEPVEKYVFAHPPILRASGAVG
jgi:hypothetical protein